ncbi:MAG: protein-glutamate O-methyltransferase CheR [Firmicutes bacterium]|nr:protein-glutamate O-methyltransferase CheR [Bacillota bacterium]
MQYLSQEGLLFLEDYRRDQVERRLWGFLLREGYTDLSGLVDGLRRDPELGARLKNFLTVHVTEFFRDPPYWQRLAQKLHASGLASGRAWSAGCSWGAEPASLWLMERLHGHFWDIWATDTDVVTLQQARRLRFPKESFSPLLDPYRDMWRWEEDGTWSLSAAAHNAIHWELHDLLAEKPPVRSFDVVMSRYVLIYFSHEARHRVLENLVNAIKIGGFLFIGATETLLDAPQFGLKAVAPALFQRHA